MMTSQCNFLYESGAILCDLFILGYHILPTILLTRPRLLLHHAWLNVHCSFSMGSIETENSIASHLVSNATRVCRVAEKIVFRFMLNINGGRGFDNEYFSIYVK